MSGRTTRVARVAITAVSVVTFMSVFSLAIVANEVHQIDKRATLEIEKLERARQADVSQAVRGCQRGNEIRRAIAQLNAVAQGRAGFFDTQVPNAPIDEDARRVDDCREVANAISGRDPGPVSNFVD